MYFFEKDSPDCRRITKNVIPVLEEKYNEKIEFLLRDVAEIKNFEAMMGFEAEYGIPPQEVPQFYTSRGVLYKTDKIAVGLSKLIDIELTGVSSASLLYEQDFRGDAARLGTGARSTKGKYADFFNTYLKTGTVSGSNFENFQKQYFRQKDRLLVYVFRKNGCQYCNRLSLSIQYL